MKVEYNENNFVFTVESFGQLTCKELVLKAVDMFNDALDQLQKETVKISE